MSWKIFAAGVMTQIAMCAPGNEVDFSALPKPAQVTINRHLDGGRVQQVNRQDGTHQLIYVVEIRRESGNKQIRVDASGKLINSSPFVIGAPASAERGSGSSDQ